MLPPTGRCGHCCRPFLPSPLLRLSATLCSHGIVNNTVLVFSKQPLSAVVRQNDHNSTKGKGRLQSDTPPPRSTPPPQPPAAPQLSVLAMIMRMPGFRRRRNQTSGRPSHELKTQVVVPKPPDPVEVQVAVMVAMPRQLVQNNGDAKPEYAFGVTEVLCDLRTPSS